MGIPIQKSLLKPLVYLKEKLFNQNNFWTGSTINKIIHLGAPKEAIPKLHDNTINPDKSKHEGYNSYLFFRICKEQYLFKAG